MPDINLTAGSITALDHTVTRTFAEHLGDVVNVKGMGAVGDGVTDDTAAIQNAFDAAYGTWGSPHGGLQDLGSAMYTNKAVFFPAGRYLVSPAIDNRAVTGAANAGDGRIKLTVSTTGLSTGDPVCIAGVGGTTEANAIWFVDVVDATHLTLRHSTFSNTYTSGGTLTTPCLRLRMVRGAHIYGAGRMAALIVSATANASTIATNAFDYSKVGHLGIAAALGGACFQLDWTAPDASTTVQLQSNTIEDCWFGGIAGAGAPSYGVTVGVGTNMGSELLLLNNYFAGLAVAGIYVANYNALSVSVIGGNIAHCDRGILVAAGSAGLISGVGFQYSADVDIEIVNAAEEAYSITGCRSEQSLGFLRTGSGHPYNVTGCSFTGLGAFFSGNGYVTLYNCKVVNGYVESYSCYLDISNCVFGNSNYLSAGVSDNYYRCRVFPSRVIEKTDAAYPIISPFDSAKILSNRATAQTVTVLKNSDSSCNLQAGAKIEIQQIGAGQVTVAAASGVTIRSANGLKLRAQYSCATLTCDGSDLWTLSGDTTP